jgi:hypothetical protein
MKRVILAMGLVATLGGCYAVWSGFSTLNRDAVIERMAQAERNEVLDPIRRLLKDAVRLDPQAATPPAPGTKVILTGELVAGSAVADPELDLSRPGTAR